MILTSKVILNTIYPFDINNGYNFTFSYQGAEEVDGNVLRIYEVGNAKTPIITQFQDGTKLNSLSSVTTKSYKMQNGEKYFATISMANNHNELVNTCSDPVYFYCFTTPTLSFKNTEIFEQPIKSSSFIVELDYQYDKTGTYQDELNEYKVVVYPYADDVNQLSIYETKRAWATDLNNLTAYITDLDVKQNESKSYYLKALGITKFGVSIESPLLKIDIQNDKQYIKTAFNAILQNQSASIYLSSNLIHIEGTAYGEISFENGKVIIPKGSSVKFQKDVDLQSVEKSVFEVGKGNNFMLSLKFSNFPINSDILILNDATSKNRISLSTQSNKIYSLDNSDYIEDGTGFLILTAKNNDFSNVLRTNSLELNYRNAQKLCNVELLVIIKRTNGVFDMQTKIIN